MLIEGLFHFSVLDNDYGVRELHLRFSADFQALAVNKQAEQMQAYWASLENELENLPDTDPNLQGMLIVQQVTEQLLPHIQSGEVPLTEEIVIQIQPDSPLSKFMGIEIESSSH